MKSNPFFEKERLLSNLNVAFEAVTSNSLRSFLTALGIIFGVAAVIAMLSIGKGAEIEIMNQIELVGVNNINITAFSEQDEGDVSETTDAVTSEKKPFSPGLSLHDAKNIKAVVPGVEFVSPEIVTDAKVIRNGSWRTAQLVGVTNDFFNILNFRMQYGDLFNDDQLTRGLPVCIIGHDIKSRFFNEENPVGLTIKVNNQWLAVIGVLDRKNISDESKKQTDLGIRDYNMDIYIPINTMLIRYTDRSSITAADLGDDNDNKIDHHQLDKIVVKAATGNNLNEMARIVSRLLQRRHFGVIDYSITIPELLLKQQQKTKKIFSLVLGAIAGISLLVGGIGIMNIMLASVLERIKEIGLRIALGAKKIDIIQQFLFEATIIGFAGGLVGVLLGWILSVSVSIFTDINTVITPISIIISFLVAVSTGLVFGIMPAKKAAQQSPINSLRHE